MNAIAICFKGGVVLACEKKTNSKLHINKNSKKIVALDSGLMCAFSGLNADARILLNQTKIHC